MESAPPCCWFYPMSNPKSPEKFSPAILFKMPILASRFYVPLFPLFPILFSFLDFTLSDHQCLFADWLIAGFSAGTYALSGKDIDCLFRQELCLADTQAFDKLCSQCSRWE